MKKPFVYRDEPKRKPGRDSEVTHLAQSTGPPTAEQMQLVQSLYERYKGLFYQVASERARDGAETDDVVSEALLRLFRNADRLRGLEERALVDYIADTLRSVATDFGRRHGTERRLFFSLEEDDLPAMPEPGPEERYLLREGEQSLRRHLRETLLELSETDRALLVGRYYENATDEELARQLGVRPASIRMKLTRARKRARRILERKEGGGHG